VNAVLLFAFVFLAVLGPPVKLAAGLPVLRPEMMVVGVALAIRHTRMDFQGDVPRLLAGFGVTAAVAIGASYGLFDVPYDGSDFSIFPMLVQYWLVYCFGLACIRKGMRAGLLWAVVLAVSISSFIALLQKLNLFGVNEWLTPLYVGPDGVHAFIPQWLASGSSTSRAVGTVGDPRHCAMMFGYGVSAALTLLLAKGDRTFKIVLCAAMGIMGAGLLVTYSRTGVLATSGGFVVGLWLAVRRGGNPTIPLLMGGIAALAILFVSGRLGVTEEESRLTMSASEMVDTSGYARIRDTLEPFQASLTNPLILITGMGPSKAVLPGSEHGETGWLVMRYGLVGFFIYLAMVRRAIIRSLWINLAGRPSEAMMASFVLKGITVWMVFFFAESVFKLAQLMSINLLLLATAAGVLGPATRRVSRSELGDGEARLRSNKGNTKPSSAGEQIVSDPDLQL